MTGLKRILHSRRGFTLVELVVVLVILGVTASVGVPALTGYIDNAKEKQAVSETQACVETATRLAAAKYAEYQHASLTPTSTGTTAETLSDWHDTVGTAQTVTTGTVALTEGSGMYYLNVPSPAPDGASQAHDVAADAGVSGHVSQLTCNANGQVLYLVYTSADGIQVVYTAAGTAANVKDNDDGTIVVPKPDDTKPDPKPDPDPDPDPVIPEVKKLDVTFYKVDADTGAAVSGAMMRVTNEAGFTEDWNTKDSASHTVQLPVGTYVYREVTAPDDYLKADDISFEVYEGDNENLLIRGTDDSSAAQVNTTENRVTMKDAKDPNAPSSKDLTFRVRDPDTGEYLSDFSFNLTLTDGTIIASGTTDKTGTISFKVYLGDKDGQPHPHTYHDYVLTPTSWPVGRQQVFSITFGLFPCHNDGTDDTGRNPENFKLSGWNDWNHNGANYPAGTVSDDGHIYTLYNPAVKYGYITEIDTDGNPIKNAMLKVTQGSRSFTINTNDGIKKVALKLHDGDTIPDGEDYLVNKTQFTIQQTITPTGYTVPRDRTIIFNDTFGTQGYDSTVRISEDGLTVSLILEEKPTCTTVFRKIDDRGVTVSNAQLQLTSEKTDSIVFSQWYSGYSHSFWTPDSQSYELKPDTFTLKEISTPSGYTTATPITFTINKGEYNKVITMVDHNLDEETGDVTLDTITFTNAKNWAHKLTQDDSLNFHHEVLYWKGDYYYSYEIRDNLSNEYPDIWTDKKLDLDADADHDGYTMAPDPVTFYNTHKSSTDPAGIVLKLGALWNETTIKNVSARNTIKRGDLYLYQNKLYVYTGSEELTSAPPAQPNKNTSNYPYEYYSYWEKIDDGKYTIK